MGNIKKILVANRGEIALRVMRSAREMGISTVAIYSDADRHAPHVRYADESIHIGPSPSAESYLDGDKIIAESQKYKVDAIHPGYGFLSENEDFADSVSRAGLTFIGPSAESIKLMGSKLAAKDAVSKFGIPMVTGTSKAISEINEAMELTQTIGFPLLIKANAGGGGKGMRIVRRPDQLEEEMNRAISEAESAFGDGSVFLEKYIESNKHIEFQILGDKNGNVVHLFDRECSIQRRHQKVIEEAPSSALTPALRKEMGEAAVKVARASNYYGAGTVEFIFDNEQNYYFLEMNTRLQVEHPVTEEITGLDLVKEQIRIAEGADLRFSQEDLSFSGHAIELRVYAEDPSNHFLPDVGTLRRYKTPQGPGVRVDDGFEEGMEVPIYYDPMISKLIVKGSDRLEALSRLTRAIDEYVISGIKTTLGFGKFVVNHPSFKDGTFTTKFVEDHFEKEYESFLENADPALSDVAVAVGVNLLNQLRPSRDNHIQSTSGNEISKWRLNRRIE